MYDLKILSWNINGVSTKLEKISVSNLLYQYDVTGLNEVKKKLPHLPPWVRVLQEQREWRRAAGWYGSAGPPCAAPRGAGGGYQCC